MSRKKKATSFTDLTWEDLKEWAGTKIVSRGRSYKSSVDDLRATEDGSLLAWVQGSEQYATRVAMTDPGGLSSECTCPYDWGPCKHAVAVVLVYLDAMKNKQEVPLVTPEDARFQHIADESSDEDWDEDDDWDEDNGISTTLKRRGLRSTAGRKSATDEELTKYLSGLSRESLTGLMLELAAEYGEAREKILDRARLQDGRVERIAESVRREIESLADEPAWSHHWSGEGHIPDYSRVCERMRTLLAGGHADEVVSLGEHLLRLGMKQVGMSHDDGDTGMEISSCMSVVFRAVTMSSLSPAQQLLWEINAHLEDEYSILDGLKGPLSHDKYSKGDWDTVANSFAERLTKMPAGDLDDRDRGFHRRYERESVMRWLIQALEKAGRKDEVIPLLEREVPVTGCYADLVGRLISAGRREDADTWAREGFERTIGKLDGIAWSLEERLRNFAQQDGDKLLVSSYRAMEFFDRPEISRYAGLEKAATAAKVWPVVRARVLHYLETGVRPDIQSATEKPAEGTKRAKTKGPAAKSMSSARRWPLPPTGLNVPPEDKRWQSFPDTSTLIDIAIREKRNEDVVKWHERASKRSGLWATDTDDKVAEAVQKTHPDFALKLWKQLAGAHIAQAKPAAYQVAGGYLKKMKTVYHCEKRPSEWERYLSELRTENKRRPRMMEVLDSLEGIRKRIIDK